MITRKRILLQRYHHPARRVNNYDDCDSTMHCDYKHDQPKKKNPFTIKDSILRSYLPISIRLYASHACFYDNILHIIIIDII